MKFIDPRVDFAFKKIFGSEETKEVLKSFLEAVLSLRGDRKLKEINIINPYNLPKLAFLKTSILDVKCTDHRNITYLVEMQIRQAEDFLKRVQYKLSKAYSGQIKKGELFPQLNQVIGITITNFTLFPEFPHYLSCHSTRENITNREYMDQIIYYFIELEKFEKKETELENEIDKWVYFIKYAETSERIPPVLEEEPYKTAFETAQISNMTEEEYDAYDKASMIVTEYYSSLEVARREGLKEGKRRRA